MPAAKRITLTVDRLREQLGYDPKTGVFTWLGKRPGPAQAGRIAGHVCRKAPDRGGGYRSIKVDGQAYSAHRLAWMYVHGHCPDDHEIDHENFNRDDNRIANLRLATRGQNMINRASPKNGSSGIKGVTRHETRWRARVSLNGRRIHLGSFATKEEAAAAYAVAEPQFYGEFSQLA